MKCVVVFIAATCLAVASAGHIPQPSKRGINHYHGDQSLDELTGSRPEESYGQPQGYPQPGNSEHHQEHQHEHQEHQHEHHDHQHEQHHDHEHRTDGNSGISYGDSIDIRSLEGQRTSPLLDEDRNSIIQDSAPLQPSRPDFDVGAGIPEQSGPALGPEPASPGPSQPEGTIIGAPYLISIHKNILRRYGIPVARPYPVQVPRDVRVPVEHPVPYKVDRPYAVRINVPQPYAVDQPYPVPVVRPYSVQVPQPVGVPVPRPYPVQVPEPVPVPVPGPVAVHRAHPVAVAHAHPAPLALAHHAPLAVAHSAHLGLAHSAPLGVAQPAPLALSAHHGSLAFAHHAPNFHLGSAHLGLLHQHSPIHLH